MSAAAEKTAEVIDEFTAGWEIRQIQEVAEVNPRIDKKAIPDDIEVSFVPMPAVEAESGAIDVSQTKLAKEVKKGFTAFLQGDVLFAKITPCMENGKMAIAPALVNDYGFGSTEFHVLRPSEDIDAKYLYYYVSSRSFRGEAERFMTGAVGQKRVSTTYLKEATIPVAPLEDQRRIVAEIEKQFSRLDEAVASLKRVKANLKRYKASVLKAAVEGEITEEWRKQNPDVEPASKFLERILADRRTKWEEAEIAKMKAKGKEPKNNKWKEKYKEPSKPALPNVQHFPSGWQAVSLESVSDALGGYAFKSKLFVESGPQVVKMANIKMGKLDLTARPSFIRDVQEDVLSKYTLVDGDILVTLTGTRKKRDYGYVVQVREPQNILLLNQRIARLRPYLRELSDYLAISLEGEEFRNRFFLHETGNVGQGNVGMKAVTTEYVLLPPMDEQQEIVQEWQRMESVVLELLTITDQQLRRAESLRRSILARSFVGG